MAAKKLTSDQVVSLKELAARMTDQEGATAREVAEAWNSTHPIERHLTSRAVLYHMLVMRRETLSKASAHVEAITARVVERLVAMATADPRSVVTWEGDDLVMKDSSALTEGEAAQLSIKVSGRGKDRAIEFVIDPSVKARAGKDLLTFLHGSRVTVTEQTQIVAQLTKCGDREGLQRIVNGEDAIKVLISRAPFLKISGDEPADGED